MKNVILSDIINLVSGGTPKTTVKEYWDGEIGWLSINDFNNDLRKVYSTEKKITKKGLEESNTKILEIDDIIISARGTVGALAQIGKPMAFNQSCFGIRGKKEIVNNTYLYYALKNYVANIQSKGQGSVFNTINLNSFKLMKINIEQNIDLQIKISDILSLLDNKIELNRKINDNLEQMAKAIYDYWFVQFDFPNEINKPYKSSGGEMVYNEELKREIPKGWRVENLSSFIGADKSGDWGKEIQEGNYIQKVECIRGADINGINGKGEIKAPVRYILERNNHKILLENDFIVEISGGSPVQSTGRIACITNEVLRRFFNPLICSNFCKAVSLKALDDVFFFLCTWNRAYDSGVLFSYEGKTSGIKNLLFEDFVITYLIAKPSETLLKDFNNRISILERKRQQNLKQNRELTQLRDWLLPMLMNGQITVK